MLFVYFFHIKKEKHNSKRLKQLCGLNGQHRAVPPTCSQNVTQLSEYKILYDFSTWGEFASATDVCRIDALLKRARALGYQLVLFQAEKILSYLKAGQATFYTTSEKPGDDVSPGTRYVHKLLGRTTHRRNCSKLTSDEG